MKQEQLQEVVRLHGLWLDGMPDGERANLPGANLVSADLVRARMNQAWLPGADLERANMLGTKLRGAYLDSANMEQADMRGADLRQAILNGAFLRGAILRGADLGGAILCSAKLPGADLERAILREADLERANLRGAKLPPGYGTLGRVGGRYIVNWSPEKIFIGCEAHSRAEWLGFTDDEIAWMDEDEDADALSWWQAQRDEIITAYDASQKRGE